MAAPTDGPTAALQAQLESLNEICNKIEAAQNSVDYVTGLVEEKKNEFEQMKIDHEAKIAKITKASRKSRLKQRQAAGVGDAAVGLEEELLEQQQAEASYEDGGVGEDGGDIGDDLRRNLILDLRCNVPNEAPINLMEAAPHEIITFLHNRARALESLECHIRQHMEKITSLPPNKRDEWCQNYDMLQAASNQYIQLERKF